MRRKNPDVLVSLVGFLSRCLVPGFAFQPDHFESLLPLAYPPGPLFQLSCVLAHIPPPYPFHGPAGKSRQFAYDS